MSHDCPFSEFEDAIKANAIYLATRSVGNEVIDKYYVLASRDEKALFGLRFCPFCGKKIVNAG